MILAYISQALSITELASCVLCSLAGWHDRVGTSLPSLAIRTVTSTEVRAGRRGEKKARTVSGVRWKPFGLISGHILLFKVSLTTHVTLSL